MLCAKYSGTCPRVGDTTKQGCREKKKTSALLKFKHCWWTEERKKKNPKKQMWYSRVSVLVLQESQQANNGKKICDVVKVSAEGRTVVEIKWKWLIKNALPSQTLHGDDCRKTGQFLRPQHLLIYAYNYSSPTCQSKGLFCSCEEVIMHLYSFNEFVMFFHLKMHVSLLWTNALCSFLLLLLFLSW